MKTIYSSYNEMDVLILKELLEKQKIKTNILRNGASDYLNILGGNLIGDIELQVSEADVQLANKIIETTEYSKQTESKNQKEVDDLYKDTHSINAKVIFARLMLLFAFIIVILYIILQIYNFG